MCIKHYENSPQLDAMWADTVKTIPILLDATDTLF